jgi:hypothetical protein
MSATGDCEQRKAETGKPPDTPRIVGSVHRDCGSFGGLGGCPLCDLSMRSARSRNFSATVRIAEIDSRRTRGITASFT